MNGNIVLLNMPFGSIERPSLALSKIKSLASNFDTEPIVLYPNISFAEQIGVSRYYCLSTSCDVADLIGEWVFSQSAFGDKSDLFLEDYLPKTRYSLPALEHYFQISGIEKIKAALKDIRGQAKPFLSELTEAVLALNPECVGATSVFQQNCASIAILRSIKAKRPDIRTVLGGANCEGEMGEEIQRICPWIDYVHDGRAEGKIGEIFQNQKLEAQEPAPIFDDYFERLARSPLQARIKPGLLFESSTGCWYGERQHCTFCGLNGKSMAFKDRDHRSVSQELEYQEKKYGIQKFEAVDNILSMRYFRTLIPELANRNEPLQIFYETKSNLSEKHIRELSSAGITWIQPGIESMDPKSLQLLRKGNSIAGNIALLKFAIENGVRVSWNLLIGVPGEEPSSYDNMSKIFSQILHLQPPSSIVRVRIDRFSPYHAKPEEFGLNIEPMRSYQHIYPESTDLGKIAYFFDDYSVKRAESDDPALRNMIDAFVSWNNAFFSYDRRYAAELTISNCSRFVKDTRSDKPQMTELTSTERLLYEATRHPVPSETLRKRFTENLLAQWRDKHWLIDDETKAVNVLTRHPCKPLPKLSDFPGGFVEV